MDDYKLLSANSKEELNYEKTELSNINVKGMDDIAQKTVNCVHLCWQSRQGSVS